MRNLGSMLTLTAALVLTACGSSTSGRTDPEVESVAGVWTGTVVDPDDVNPDENEEQILMLTTDDGELRLITLQQTGQVSGRFDPLLIVDDLKGNASFDTDEAIAYVDDTTLANCELEATVFRLDPLNASTEDKLFGSYICDDEPDPTQRSFGARYDDLNETEASAATIRGTWATNPENGPMLKLVIDSFGNIIGSLTDTTGTDDINCEWTGTVNPIEGENLYRLALDLVDDDNTCDTYSDIYNGLGTIALIADAPDQFIFQINSDSTIFADVAFRVPVTPLAGVWTGFAVDSADPNADNDLDQPIFMFTTDSGELRLVALDSAIQASGGFNPLLIDDDLMGTASLEAIVTAFTPQGFFVGDTIEIGNCVLDVVITRTTPLVPSTDDTLTGDYVCDDDPNNSFGSIDTDYSSINDTESSAETIAELWYSEKTVGNGSPELSLNIDSDGNIIGDFLLNDLRTCSWTGTATPIPGDNLYDVVFTLDPVNCGVLTDTYNGLGTIVTEGTQKRLILQANSDALIFAYALVPNP